MNTESLDKDLAANIIVITSFLQKNAMSAFKLIVKKVVDRYLQFKESFVSFRLMLNYAKLRTFLSNIIGII